jgi:hypothetical protein
MVAKGKGNSELNLMTTRYSKTFSPEFGQVKQTGVFRYM